jgi:hypothetical protein
MWMGVLAGIGPRRSSASGRGGGWLAASLAVATLLAAAPARADRLTPAELGALERGDVVKRAIDPDLPGGAHVGGLSYAVVQAPPEAVTRALLDVNTYRWILPLTVEAREVARAGSDRWVVIKHGGRFGSVEYTALVRPCADGTIRFWLDPEYPHEVDGAWGFFRVEPRADGKALLSYGAVVDLGDGIAGLFFKDKIRRYALETPRLVRRWVEDHVAAQAHAALLGAPSAPAPALALLPR